MTGRPFSSPEKAIAARMRVMQAAALGTAARDRPAHWAQVAAACRVRA